MNACIIKRFFALGKSYTNGPDTSPTLKETSVYPIKCGGYALLKKNISWKQLLIGFDKFSTHLPCQQSLTISWPSCSFRPSCCWAWYWSPLHAPAKHPLVLVGKPRGVVRLSSERNLSHDYYNQLTTYQVGCASTQPPEAIPCHRKPNHFLSPTEIFHCYGPIVAQVGLVKTWSKQVTHPALPNMM